MCSPHYNRRHTHTGHKTMKTSTVIAQTTKGHRVYLEGLTQHVGQRYNIVYSGSCIHIEWNTEGKRKVVARGVIDIEGKRVSTWRDTSTHVDIEYNAAGITCTRVG